MPDTRGNAVAVTLAGIGAAARARRGLLLAVAAAVVILDVLAPPLVLSLARKPVDYVTWNPWLPQLPGYLRAGPGSLGERLDRAWNLALFWCSADGPFGAEWGFAVSAADLCRFALMGLLVGLYFALWAHRRARLAATGWAARAGAPGGFLGAATSVLGVASGGCTVMGCGAPVIPVLGLAFVGLSSTTLKWMAEASSLATSAVLLAMGAGVAYLGWRVGRLPTPAAPTPALR